MAGLWLIPWPEDGVQTGEFPTVGTINATDTTHNRNHDGGDALQLKLGGITSGTGSLNIHWVRVRQYTDIVPSFTTGVETGIGSPPGPVVPVPVNVGWMILLLLLSVALVGFRPLQ